MPMPPGPRLFFLLVSSTWFLLHLNATSMSLRPPCRLGGLSFASYYALPNRFDPADPQGSPIGISSPHWGYDPGEARRSPHLGKSNKVAAA